MAILRKQAHTKKIYRNINTQSIVVVVVAVVIVSPSLSYSLFLRFCRVSLFIAFCSRMCILFCWVFSPFLYRSSFHLLCYRSTFCIVSFMFGYNFIATDFRLVRMLDFLMYAVCPHARDRSFHIILNDLVFVRACATVCMFIMSIVQHFSYDTWNSVRIVRTLIDCCRF